MKGHLIMQSRFFYPRPKGRHTRSKGFTLIEVMIVVAILAILAAIALPSYREYVMRSKRADAKAGLQAAAVWLERVSTSTGMYLTTSVLPTELQTTPSGSSAPRRTYTISYVTPDPSSTATVAGTSYVLTATPQDSQAHDKCGNFTLTNTGVQDLSGTYTLDKTDCWNR